MKKISTLFLLAAGCCMLLIACNTTTPENYFDRAVLNCNMMMDFANDGMQREFEQPSVKLVEGTKDQTAPMKRKEIIDDKIKYLDESFSKIKALKETDDTRVMLKASVALYEYVLPVYKNEYVQVAKLYDDNAPKEQIETLSKTIRDKYSAGFLQRFDALTNAGKPYAERHSIKVNWGVKTSPDLH
ncbi:MAG: hypothetical protein ABJB86_04755 [Bacteroidota bacterium]